MSKTNEFYTSVKNLGITAGEVTNYITSQDMPEKQFFTGLLETELQTVRDETVLYGYSLFPASVSDNSLLIEDTEFNVGHDVATMLRSVEQIVVFACTLSNNLNDHITKYDFNTHYLEAYMKDILGNVIIEKTAQKLLEQIKSDSRFSDLKVSNSISPGNCGWPVEEQKKLFALLPDNFLGIQLNESGMMYPVKSLSGIIGIGKKVRFKQTECRYCKSKNCMFRKEEYAGNN